MRIRAFIGLFLVGTLLLSCSRQPKPIVVEEVSLLGSVQLDVPERLSEWGLFQEPLGELIPTVGVVPYELNTPLFSDYALKSRFVKLPDGEVAAYHGGEVFDFPEGTILIKNFYYPQVKGDSGKETRILETRLLVHEPKGWKAWTYVWNEQQKEAVLEIAGKSIAVAWQDDQGVLRHVNYSVPNLVQCKSCHERAGHMTPIGPSARQLNRLVDYGAGAIHQLSYWQDARLLDSLPALTEVPRLAVWNDSHSGTLDERARAWLEINCAHCHREDGPAKNSGLHLLASETNAYRIGVYKPPIAAGRGSAGLTYGIVPGDPDASILVSRIESLDPGVMMPELGRKVVHEEGIRLIREWIAQME